MSTFILVSLAVGFIWTTLSVSITIFAGRRWRLGRKIHSQ